MKTTYVLAENIYFLFLLQRYEGKRNLEERK